MPAKNKEKQNSTQSQPACETETAVREVNERKRSQTSTKEKVGAHSDENDDFVEYRLDKTYLKSLQLQKFNAHGPISGVENLPDVQTKISVSSEHIEGDCYESAICFQATATNAHGKVYELDVIYVGVVTIKSMETIYLRPLLQNYVPSLIFPYLRRLVCDITGEGGYPAMVLEPFAYNGKFDAHQLG